MSKFWELHHQDGSVSDMTLGDGIDPIEELAKWPEEQRSTIVNVVAVTAFRDRSNEAPPPYVPTFKEVPDDVKTTLLQMGEAMNALHGRFEQQAVELVELRDFKNRFDATMGGKS